MMTLRPEQRLAQVRSGLVRLIEAKTPLSSTEIFPMLGESMRRSDLSKLLQLDYIVKLGSRNFTKYVLSQKPGALDALVELAEDPEKISSFIWPRFEGHLGNQADDGEETEETDEGLEDEEAAPAEELSGSLGALSDRQLLEGIANNLGGLTQLVAAIFTQLKEGGDMRSVDLTPFVQSYSSLQERITSVEKKINNVEVGLGLIDGSKDTRSSGAGVQGADDREGKGAAGGGGVGT